MTKEQKRQFLENERIRLGARSFKDVLRNWNSKGFFGDKHVTYNVLMGWVNAEDHALTTLAENLIFTPEQRKTLTKVTESD